MAENTICDPDLLPVGLTNFSNIRESNMIYVDKTDIIARIAKKRTPIFFSRPRRFGKSLLTNTFFSLFANGLEYFHGLAIDNIWEDKTYQVVRLDFSTMADLSVRELKIELGEAIISKFRVKNSISQYNGQELRSPSRILNEIAESLPNNSTVLLIDEYDAPLTHHIDRPDELHDIISIFNNFYSTIKEYTDKFRFIFITGITRTSHISLFSTFNNLVDLSFDEEYNSLLGFTRDDIIRYFDPYVENSAKILKMSKDDVYYMLEQYYDGYQFVPNTKNTVYNPWSLLNFFQRTKKGFYNYWFESGGTPSILMQYIKLKDAFDFMDYEKREIILGFDELSCKYEITDIPRNIILYQSGYFTIRDNNGILSLSIPNIEVEQSLLLLYLRANNLKPSLKLQKRFTVLSNYIDNKELDKITDIFNSILNECVSSSSSMFKDERSLRDIIFAALIQTPSFQIIKERETVKGSSDLELITDKTCMIIEFKRTYPTRGPEASLKKAIEQIKNNRYGLLYSNTHTLYRVAMVVSSKEKMILNNFCKEVF